MMERIIFVQDKFFTLRDHNGKWHRNLTRDEADELCTQAELREAMKWDQFREYPLPSFDIESGLYYWGDDIDDQYDADEIGDDLAKIGWPVDHVPMLLELARSCARLDLRG